MEQLRQKITLTGYRILIILQLLMKGPVSKNEILKEIHKNPRLQNVSHDTIRLDINTLKAGGFIVKSPQKSSDYKYTLNWNPISIKITPQEIRSLNAVKKAVISVADWKFIINLYQVFEKLSQYVEDRAVAAQMLNFGYFMNIDFQLLKELDTYTKRSCEITIQYDSPSNGIKQMQIQCVRIGYDRKSTKLYLWCKMADYPNLSYLRIDRIVNILKVHKIKASHQTKVRVCRYKIKGQSVSTFSAYENEKVIVQNEEILIIEAEIESEFHFLQRLLSFGADCIYVSDKSILKKLIDSLSKTKEIYV